ncbi:hypothetical protein [Haladaptatus sp. T7]|uniref:hypothetical protein n=1 Tax=Haladaptatus sp. T7 TaxID=2029368 RepID=UPI0021A25145|nr:hypothetical protein [Haladaptatus sp. T7]GKZ13172.1 hypothetical protein HAL_10530 [Haladaptatus sp. T7]
MPSRRDVLTTISACAAGGALAGCSALAAVGGYVEKKQITGTRRQNGGLRDETVVSVELSELADDPVVSVAERWVQRFPDPKRLRISETFDDRLRDEYESLGYVVGVCSPDWSSGSDSVGCYTAPTGRDDFNRAQVGDRVRASYSNSKIRIRSNEGTWVASGRKKRT